MNTMWYRAFWSLLTISILVIAVGVLLKLPQLMEKSANPSLNKAAVGPDTPYIVLGMGCFWGAEKRMQALTGVLDVEAGYAGGDILNPSYETLHDTEASIQAGKAVKNHAEVVKVYYDSRQTTLEQVLIRFWESHNPTQGNRQGNDIGSNYRSAVFYRTDEERQWAEKTRAIYQANLKTAGIAAPITSEIASLRNYTSAEAYHQDYLEKNPLGYCGLGGTGVAYFDPDMPVRTENPHSTQVAAAEQNWQQIKLNAKEQLIAFESVECGYCKQFDKEVLSAWKNPISIVSTNLTIPPDGWKLSQALFATPTIVLFRDRQEVARYTGYQGAQHFRKWLGDAALSN
ncbi:peptide-methionine (S)-S-oxide reductase MsrA [Candidatus Methylobacter oryzae]|uniref:Peptide methionine sulfoxide reductase MsrA n=1 Tax=Candidatus Methylobacter oryzae TaxID=2497749 RepID=A0ABY3C4G3_9GAMM|nr:peptide-methionine (S)-S-oxide reductase MsrA [Candidatus Methylobacter oryzae]TRW89599.1 peptide-methionine (S)-S-oxide reductase MsrA [Candidatus Methylobacter oryzae]